MRGFAFTCAQALACLLPVTDCFLWYDAFVLWFEHFVFVSLAWEIPGIHKCIARDYMGTELHENAGTAMTVVTLGSPSGVFFLPHARYRIRLTAKYVISLPLDSISHISFPTALRCEYSLRSLG